MEKVRSLSLVLLIGVIVAGSGTSFLALSAVDYNYSHGLTQYAEFWVVARSGGGLGTVGDSDLYVKCFPLSADPSDLRVASLSFNVSALQYSNFVPMVQWIAMLSAPNSPVFNTPWLRNLGNTMSDQATMELLQAGLATPHNITVRYVEAVLSIFANDTSYTFSLGRNPYASYTEKNDTIRAGLVYGGWWGLEYHPIGTFTYYVPGQNNPILNLAFNSGGNLSFSLRFDWNVTFEQKYGSSLEYAGNATIANWVFSKLDADTIGVSINLDNSNYHPPVPAFTVVPWSPLFEVGVIVTGFMVTVIVLVFRRRLGHKVDEKSDNGATSN